MNMGYDIASPLSRALSPLIVKFICDGFYPVNTGMFIGAVTCYTTMLSQAMLRPCEVLIDLFYGLGLLLCAPILANRTKLCILDIAPLRYVKAIQKLSDNQLPFYKTSPGNLPSWCPYFGHDISVEYPPHFAKHFPRSCRLVLTRLSGFLRSPLRHLGALWLFAQSSHQ